MVVQQAPMNLPLEVSPADVQAMIERVIGLLDELRGPTLTAPAVATPSGLPTTVPPLAAPDPIGLPIVVAPPAAVTPPPPLPVLTSRSSPVRSAPLPPPVPRPPVPVPGGQVGQWIAQATAILAAHGVPASEMNPHDIAVIIQHESGGNPHAINRSDANARAGHPSKGLMQTVDATFDRYELPGHNDIYNPVDNIIAGVRYAIATYGSVTNAPGIRSLNLGHDYRGY